MTAQNQQELQDVFQTELETLTKEVLTNNHEVLNKTNLAIQETATTENSRLRAAVKYLDGRGDMKPKEITLLNDLITDRLVMLTSYQTEKNLNISKYIFSQLLD